MGNGAWRATTQQQAYANPKSMIDIFNFKTPRVYRIYRMWAFNNQYLYVVGVVGYLNIYRTVSVSGGWTIAPIANDTSNLPLNVDLTCGTNRGVTLGSLFRRVGFSSDEPASYTIDWDAMLTLVAYAEIWNAGYSDSVVDPLTCRANVIEGYTIYSTIMTTGVGDFEIEFTDKAT